MLKTYKSKMTALRILVKVGGKVVPVEFHWDLIYPNSGIRGCSFSTEDVELQKAIESHEYFGRTLQPSIWTDDKEEVVPIEEKKDIPAPKTEETPAHEDAVEPTTESAPATDALPEETPTEEVAPQNEEVAVEPTTEAETLTPETPVEETPADEAKEHSEAIPENGPRKEFPEVTKMMEVRTILKEVYGKTASEVKSNAQVLALINELGLTFPNLK